MQVRAKFQCEQILIWATSRKQYKFRAVGADDIPENQRYHRYTPAGSLEITVDNPAVSFEIGQYYYLDFTEA